MTFFCRRPIGAWNQSRGNSRSVGYQLSPSFHVSLFFLVQGKEKTLFKMVKHVPTLFGQAIECHHFQRSSWCLTSLPVIWFWRFQCNDTIQNGQTFVHCLEKPFSTTIFKSLPVTLFCRFQGNGRTPSKMARHEFVLLGSIRSHHFNFWNGPIRNQCI